jgi:hypothetical protein
MVHDLMNILVAQAAARRFIALKTIALKRLERSAQEQRTNKAATTIQSAWRGFWRYSHFLIMRYEAVRLQAVARGRIAHKKYTMALGCCIMIQSMARKYLAAKITTLKKLEIAVANSKILCLRESISAKKIQFWLRVVLICQKERKAALVIERFFIMVKDEVDREIARKLNKKKVKSTRPRRKKKSLEQTWLGMLDHDNSAEVFSFSEAHSKEYKSRTAIKSPSNGRPPTSTNERTQSIRHAASSPSMRLVMRHDLDDSPSSKASKNTTATRASLTGPRGIPVVRDKTLARSSKSLIDDDDSNHAREEAVASTAVPSPKSPLSASEKYRMLYGMKTAPSRSSSDHHFFGEDKSASKLALSDLVSNYENNSAKDSRRPSPSYKMVPTRTWSGSNPITNSRSMTASYPRPSHGRTSPRLHIRESPRSASNTIPGSRSMTATYPSPSSEGVSPCHNIRESPRSASNTITCSRSMTATYPSPSSEGVSPRHNIRESPRSESNTISGSRSMTASYPSPSSGRVSPRLHIRESPSRGKVLMMESYTPINVEKSVLDDDDEFGLI